MSMYKSGSGGRKGCDSASRHGGWRGSAGLAQLSQAHAPSIRRRIRRALRAKLSAGHIRSLLPSTGSPPSTSASPAAAHQTTDATPARKSPPTLPRRPPRRMSCGCPPDHGRDILGLPLRLIFKTKTAQKKTTRTPSDQSTVRIRQPVSLVRDDAPPPTRLSWAITVPIAAG